jgi:hypothetical protein
MYEGARLLWQRMLPYSLAYLPRAPPSTLGNHYQHECLVGSAQLDTVVGGMDKDVQMHAQIRRIYDQRTRNATCWLPNVSYAVHAFTIILETRLLQPKKELIRIYKEPSFADMREQVRDRWIYMMLVNEKNGRLDQADAFRTLLLLFNDPSYTFARLMQAFQTTLDVGPEDVHALLQMVIRTRDITQEIQAWKEGGSCAPPLPP